MFDKINNNLSLIVYRYEWQSNMNEVNKEHLYMFRFTGCLETRMIYQLDFGTTGPPLHTTLKFNSRILSDRNRLVFRINHYNMYENYIRLWDGISLVPQNYVYTSTKYLQEIEERGIECLIK